MALTPKQEAFVDEYLVDLNGTQAAIRAGYSVSRAGSQAVRLLASASIRSRIQGAMKEREQRTRITQDRVLQELARLAFGDLRRAFHDDGALKLPHEMDDETAAMLSGIDTLTTSVGGEDAAASTLITKKVKVFDKTAALTLCMRHLGLLNDRLQVHATVTGGCNYTANIPKRGA